MALVQLVQVARRLYAAVVAGKDAADDSVRSVLFPATPPVDNPPWGLALVFGALLRKKAGDSLEEVADTGIVPVVNQLTQYQGAFPPSFQTFLNRAQSAQNAGDIAAAGSYFATATKELGVFVKPTLIQYLRSDGYSKVSVELQKRAGEPVENRSADNSTPAQPTRLDKPQVPALPPSRQEPASAPTKPSDSTALPEREMQIAVLVRSGWTLEQAQRILDGPDRSQMTTSKSTERPVVDGKSILDKASPGNANKENSTEATSIAGAIKSGAELLQQLIKLAQNTGGGGSKGKPDTQGSMFPDLGGSTMSVSPYMDEDSGYSTDLGGSPSYDFVNDSSEVID